MDIFLAFDENYAIPAQVLIQSILDHNGRRRGDFRFWLALDDVSDTTRRAIESQLDGEAQYEFIDTDSLGDINTHSSLSSMNRITRASFIRLYLDRLLPKSVERVLYLDSDILCIGDLTSLAELDLGSFAFGAVIDAQVPVLADDNCIPGLLSYPDIDPRGAYFNAGVLLIDRRVWREREIEARATEYLERFRDELRYLDQDALNIAGYGYWRALAPRWNYTLPTRLEPKLRGNLADATLVHFTTYRKVWLDTFFDGELKRLYTDLESRVRTHYAG